MARIMATYRGSTSFVYGEENASTTSWWGRRIRDAQWQWWCDLFIFFSPGFKYVILFSAATCWLLSPLAQGSHWSPSDGSGTVKSSISCLKSRCFYLHTTPNPSPCATQRNALLQFISVFFISLPSHPDVRTPIEYPQSFPLDFYHHCDAV